MCVCETVRGVRGYLNTEGGREYLYHNKRREEEERRGSGESKRGGRSRISQAGNV